MSDNAPAVAPAVNPLAKDLSENDMANHVIRVLHKFGYLVHRDPPFRATATYAGFPDILACHPDGRIIALELKSERGRLSEMQCVWGRALKAAGVPWYVLRPSGWYAGHLEGWLK